MPAGKVNDPAKGEAGAEAERLMTDLMGGGPDFNPELSGAAKFPVYEEMAATDPTVKSLIWIPMLSIRGASWQLDPKDEAEPLDRMICDFVAQNLGIGDELGWMDLSWPKLVEQALGMMMRYGPCLEELVWDDLKTWRDADGDEHLTRPLARLSPRLPSSIQNFERRPDGSILRIVQNISGTKPIPGEKLSYMVFEQRPGYWDGVSLLRPAWGAWRIKKSLLISSGIGWDRFALGVPVVYHPDNPADEERARNIGRSLRSHERAYVNFPTDGPKEQSAWGLEILNAAQSLADPSPLIRLLSEQIAEAGLQHFMRQGLGQTGARATAEAQADPFYLAVEAIAGDLKRERARQVVRRIVEINFGKAAADDRCPNLTVSRIVPRDLVAISQALSYLSTAGFTFTDRGAIDDVRELIGFGRLPNDLEERGISRERLTAILTGLGLDPAALAAIVNALPADVGVARNTVPIEGGPIALPPAPVAA
jgi:hypothetical protein